MISVSFRTMTMSLRPHSVLIFASRTTLPDSLDLAFYLSKGAKRRRERAGAKDNVQFAAIVNSFPYPGGHYPRLCQGQQTSQFLLGEASERPKMADCVPWHRPSIENPASGR